MDALSVLSWIKRGWNVELPAWLGTAGAFAMAPLLLWRCPRTPASFAAAAALTFLTVFAFAWVAFANYYFLVLATFCIAIALHESSEVPDPDAVPHTA